VGAVRDLALRVRAHQIAVGIFAGGVVFGTLLPELRVEVAAPPSQLLGGVGARGGAHRPLHGARRHAGGGLHGGRADARAGRRVDAAHAFGLAKIGGWSGFRAALDPDMFNLWKPLVPPGVEGTWGAREGRRPDGLVLQHQLPVARDASSARHRRPLRYWCTRPIHRAAALGAPSEREARRGTIFASYLKLLPVFIFIIPGMIALGLARTGAVAAWPPWWMPADRPYPAWRRRPSR